MARQDAVSVGVELGLRPSGELGWVAAPAWWIPVWVEIVGPSQGLDPLQEAVLALVKAGRSDADTMAADLALPRSLTRAAAEGLVALGLLEFDEQDGLVACAESVEHSPGDEVAPRVREAWIPWDPLHARPLSIIWLDSRFPNIMLPEAVDDGALRSRPKDRDVETSLRLLPHLSTLELISPRAHGLREAPQPGMVVRLDRARLRAIRLRDGGWAKRGAFLVPTEQRLTRALVWRPTLLAHPNEVGELDPRGVDGLVVRRPDLVAELEHRAVDEADRCLQPLLDAGAYASIDELRENARKQAARGLAGFWTPRAWPRTCRALEEAFIEQEIGVLLEGDWRRLARGWAEVVEALTVELVEPARALVREAGSLPTLPPEVERRLQRVLGQTWQHLGQLRRGGDARKNFGDLKWKLAQDSDSIGHRLLAIGAAAMLDAEQRRAIQEADQALPEIFRQLDVANQERIAVIHHRARSEDLDVVGFRDRVLNLCRAWMGSGIRA